MLDYFEKEKPDVIGMDCEWKPFIDTNDFSTIEQIADNTYKSQSSNEDDAASANDPDSESNESVVMSNQDSDNPEEFKNSASTQTNIASIFQIATLNSVFIIDLKNLLTTISDSLIRKFGELIFFSDTLKLGRPTQI
jgi:hypothetical protein